MFFVYLFGLAFIVTFILFYRLAKAPYERLKEDGYSDKQINAVRNFFNINKNSH